MKKLIIPILMLIPFRLMALPGPDYQATVDSLESIRLQFQNQYLTSDEEEQQAMFADVSAFLVSALTEKLIPFWYGTKWDYNGITQVPKKGHIACGYFITTLLRDAGFRLNRVRLAQMASSTFMGIICGKDRVKWSPSKKLPGFLEEMKGQPDGLYIVGLSWHVGFFLKDGKRMRFIHSSYLEPVCVVNDDAYQSDALMESSVFVFSNVTANEAVLHKWLSGETFE